MKTILIVLVLVIIIGGGAWWYFKRQQPFETDISPDSSESAEEIPSSALPESSARETPVAPASNVTNVTKLMIEEIKVGEGAEAKAGDTVRVHYTGWLTNSTKFDSSVDRGTPFEFRLGAGEVIKGWDQGVAGMKVGGKRKLTIPPDLGYGDRGAGGLIPPGATLVFEVELLAIN